MIWSAINIKELWNGSLLCSFMLETLSYGIYGQKQSLFRVVAYNEMGTYFKSNCKQGEGIIVQGEIQHRTWNTDEGYKSIFEVILDKFAKEQEINWHPFSKNSDELQRQSEWIKEYENQFWKHQGIIHLYNRSSCLEERH